MFRLRRYHIANLPIFPRRRPTLRSLPRRTRGEALGRPRWSGGWGRGFQSFEIARRFHKRLPPAARAAAARSARCSPQRFKSPRRLNCLARRVAESAVGRRASKRRRDDFRACIARRFRRHGGRGRDAGGGGRGGSACGRRRCRLGAGAHPHRPYQVPGKAASCSGVSRLCRVRFKGGLAGKGDAGPADAGCEHDHNCVGK
mmetsp:Transcript_28442/g.95784  ORF Transcript_28442/g.95784 Transcript_28442/m.95784 type:complete len:201 (+) Transcript_28442:3759-4361(+)